MRCDDTVEESVPYEHIVLDGQTTQNAEGEMPKLLSLNQMISLREIFRADLNDEARNLEEAAIRNERCCRMRDIEDEIFFYRLGRQAHRVRN